MPITIEPAGGNTYVARISGLLRQRELRDVQSTAATEIARLGSIKLLLVLEDFQGWERGAGWGDMDFYATHGRHIEKIGIVGEDRWQDEALMFAGAGVRKAPVRYFRPGECGHALAWLAQ